MESDRRRKEKKLRKLVLMVVMLAVLALVAAPVVAQVAFEIGDAENESGEIETENALEIEGNNNNACLGTLQFGNTGNFTNQQGTLQYASEADDLEFGAGEFEFAPENETACEQEVQQAAAASSFGK